MKLIDADALINTLNEEKIKFNADTNYIILNAPTIDAEPIRHGKWIWERVYGVYSCSECGFRAWGDTMECMDGTFQYCPACGAKMEEVE